MDGAQFALNTLESEDAGGALRSISRAVNALQEQTHVEPEFLTLTDVLSSSLAQAEDAVRSLHAYLRKTDLDPQRLAQLDERMGLWISLSRRFKRQPEDLAALLQGWRTELTALDAASDLEKLAAAEKAALKDCLQEARKITQLRTQAAPQLAVSVTQAMQQLGMQGGRFEVSLETQLQPSMHGLEDVAFLVAGHSGSTPKPVGKVASGGELSRIALAIAVTTSELGEAGTLIFDEVDSGVGGAVAETVGRLMNTLGQHRQVLAVTHLPQVAACADHHLLVAKATLADGVASQVAPLSSEQRVHEIARMLGGEKLSATTMAHAREMLGHNPPQGLTQSPRKGK
jgi:DNA repair protein RecN (Recombination protein N)